MQIIIDKEFQTLIPPLTTDEYNELEKSILADGCRDALVVWPVPEFANTDHENDPDPYILENGILVDGHNRYEICTAHNVPFHTVQKDFTDRNDVKLWIMHNQLARRNLNDIQRIEIIHNCEDIVRAKAKERQEQTRFGGGGKFSTTDGKARDELGKLAGVSGKTYEHGVKVLEEAPKTVIDNVRQNAISIDAAYKVTKLEPEQQEEIVHRIEHIQDEPKETNTPKAIVQDVIKRPHVTNNSGCNEWYTPEKFVNLARKVLGNIDLDPASCEYANRTIKADKYFTIEDNGLTHEWHGNIWMNPPYTSELVTKFIEKFVDEYKHGNITSGIVLVNNATETSWFTNMVSVAKAVVFPRGRIRYESSTRDSLAPLQGQAFIYFGNDENNFLSVFSEIGWGAIIHNG